MGKERHNDRLDRERMEMAVAEARKNFKSLAGGPFGACLVNGGKILAVARNTVLRDHDPTCHAEINAIRQAARKLKTHDLSGCVIYSTTEPCPMCFSAIHWAGITAIIYGTTTEDAARLGFNELRISDNILKRLGQSRVKLIRSKSRGGCEKLFADWQRLPQKKVY